MMVRAGPLGWRWEVERQKSCGPHPSIRVGAWRITCATHTETVHARHNQSHGTSVEKAVAEDSLSQ